MLGSATTPNRDATRDNAAPRVAFRVRNPVGVRAGCHMADGRGAAGAGAYPALARNGRLAAASYPIDLVLHGHGAMPGFGRLLSDAQVAAVVGFIRSNLGNTYPDAPSEADVSVAR